MPELFGEPRRDLAPVRVVLAHAEVQRLRAAERKPGVERPGDGAGGVVNELEPLGEPVVAHDGAAADHVAVPVQILRRRVEDDVGAELERTLEVGRREGVVDDEQRAAAMRDLGHGGDVGEAHQRIARRLEQIRRAWPSSSRRRPAADRACRRS